MPLGSDCNACHACSRAPLTSCPNKIFFFFPSIVTLGAESLGTLLRCAVAVQRSALQEAGKQGKHFRGRVCCAGRELELELWVGGLKGKGKGEQRRG